MIERKATGWKTAIFITSCQGQILPTCLISVDVDLDDLAEAVFGAFFTVFFFLMLYF